MTAIAQRYGPTGSFWAQHAGLRPDPIREWQIWNEPAGDFDWRPVPWYPSYLSLLKAGYQGVKAVDRRAIVVPGAVVGLNTTMLTPWRELSDLYRSGARRYMDVVAVNAFTNALDGRPVAAAVDRNLEVYRRARAVMARHGDRRKPIYNTEVTWTAALGKLPRRDLAGFETTAKGQAARMTADFTRVAKERRLGIERVYWYTWFSGYTPARSFDNIPTFQYARLTAHAAVGRPFVKEPLLAAYARTAARLEACRKTANARVCRR
jgi:polysaccharide biosynthesis protein PslG